MEEEFLWGNSGGLFGDGTSSVEEGLLPHVMEEEVLSLTGEDFFVSFLGTEREQQGTVPTPTPPSGSTVQQMGGTNTHSNESHVRLSIMSQEESNHALPLFCGTHGNGVALPCVLELHATLYAMRAVGVCEECCVSRAHDVKWFRWKAIAPEVRRVEMTNTWCRQMQASMASTPGYSALAELYPVRWAKSGARCIPYRTFYEVFVSCENAKVALSKEVKRCRGKHQRRNF